MDSILGDIRFAARSLLKHRAFTAVAIATLAIGIGTNTAIFSVVHAALLRPLPFPNASRLYLIWGDRPESGDPQLPLSLPNVLDVRERSRSFESMAVWASSADSRLAVTGQCASGDCEPEGVQYAIVSSNLLSVLGVQPALGRDFVADDDTRGSARGVIVSRRLWQRRFGERRAIDGATITLDGRTVDVVGVLPRGFVFMTAPREPDVWLPLGLDPFRDRVYARGANALGVVGRLRPSVTASQARQELRAIAADLAREYPSFNRGWTLDLVSLRDQATGGVRDGLLLLLGAVALVLLVGCTNIANLLLARASSQQHEIALRAALGASRPRLVAQMLCESLLLSAAGGALGVLLAAWIVDVPALVPLAAPSEFVPYAVLPDQVGLDASVLAFTLGLSLVTGLLFGLLPALRASRAAPYASLTARTYGAGDRARTRMRRSLVVAETALALTLLIGAGLLLRSFARLRAIDPGFRAEQVLTVGLALPAFRYDADGRRAEFYDALIERVRALPSVRAVGGIQQLPLAGAQQTSDFRIPGAPPPRPGEEPDASYSSVTPGYFDAMGLRLLRGRFLGTQDGPRAPRVAVINETMARRFWPNESPIGKRVALSIEALRFDRPNAPPRLDFDDAAREIVGVVADVRSSGIANAALPAVYVPFAQRPVARLTLAVRTECPRALPEGLPTAACDPAALTASIRRAVRSLDPDQPLSEVVRMSDIVAASVRQPHDRTTLLAAFAAVALLLAALGVYGVTAYAVTERTQEIGMRVALGAAPGDVVRLVVGGALGTTLAGVASGLVGALASGRLLGSLLYGVTATDVPTYLAAPTVLLVAAAIASWLPARRAARVDPMEALRGN